MCHGNKNVNGLPAFRAKGIIELYDGTVLKRGRKYIHAKQRTELIEEWKNDIKRIKATDQYYFVITPNIPKDESD